MKKETFLETRSVQLKHMIKLAKIKAPLPLIGDVVAHFTHELDHKLAPRLHFVKSCMEVIKEKTGLRVDFF